MPRVTVTYSFATEEKQVRSRIRDALRGSGFTSPEVARWEADVADLGAVVDALKLVLDEAAAARLNQVAISVG